MQNPTSPNNIAVTPKLIQMPAPAALRHDFTAAQLEMIEMYRDRMAAAETHLNTVRQDVGLFLGYVRKENHLPEDGVTWSLNADAADGKPYLSGSQAKQ